jgi:hypothetical protein
MAECADEKLPRTLAQVLLLLRWSICFTSRRAAGETINALRRAGGHLDNEEKRKKSRVLVINVNMIHIPFIQRRASAFSPTR